MKNTMKKILCTVLVAVMCITCLPVSFAAETSTVEIPSDAVEFNGHYYKLFTYKKNWIDAKKHCEELNGHLVTITSEEEQNFVFYLLNDDAASIGLYDIEEEGNFKWITGEDIVYTKWREGEPNNKGDDENCAQLGTDGYWNDMHTEKFKWHYLCEWEPVEEVNIYNIGEETYGFKNYGDSDSSGGHCFGMSVTSSGYYLGILPKPFDDDKNLYELKETTAIKAPICYYHGLQGSLRDGAIVAGNNDIATDWDDVINYVNNHNYDGKGNLVIGYGKTNEGGHAVNFLRYEVVNGQERIYAYDNNCPTKETYFYQDENGNIQQAVYETFSGTIDSFICLVSVSSYLFATSGKENMDKYRRLAVYSDNSIKISNSSKYLMFGEVEIGEHYVHEISEDVTTVKITPLKDKATFTYMGKEYSFGEIDESTYAELTLSAEEGDVPEFTIINTPEDTPTQPDEPETPDETTKNCTCMCHSNEFIRFIHKLLCFFFRIFGMEQYRVCSCGKAHW